MNATIIKILIMLLLAGSPAMASFCENDPVNEVDPLGLRAYGRDHKGQVDGTFDWIEPNYTQEEVDRVYAVLKNRDRHIYNTGLNNSRKYSAKNTELLQQIIGVPVILVANETLLEVPSQLEDFGNSLQIPERDRPQMWRMHRTPTLMDEFVDAGGDLAKLAGRMLGLVATPFEFLIAGADKVVTVDPAIAATKMQGGQAVQEAKESGGTAFFWMHSEGAIHGRAFLNGLMDADLEYVQGYTFGAGTLDFNKSVPVIHHGNINIWGSKDPVLNFAAGAMHRKIDNKVIWQKNVVGIGMPHSPTGREYVHGFPTYAYYHISKRSKEYFSQNAREILKK